MEWISVDDRLPEESEDVLFVAYDEICFGQFCDRGWYSDHYFMTGVTHWMSIPAPPK